MKKAAAVAALLLLGGVGVFLLGAFVLTTDARHHDVSAAVYIGLLMAGAGLILFALLGVLLMFRRSSSAEGASPPDA